MYEGNMNENVWKKFKTVQASTKDLSISVIVQVDQVLKYDILISINQVLLWQGNDFFFLKDSIVIFDLLLSQLYKVSSIISPIEICNWNVLSKSNFVESPDIILHNKDV